MTQTKVLLVDDDPGVLDAMRAAFESKGYAVFAAHDGNQGMALAEREAPDLVVLDLVMPRRSGLHVLESLRSTEGGGPAVIMISATAAEQSRRYAESRGVNQFLAKPFRIEELLAVAERLLS